MLLANKNGDKILRSYNQLVSGAQMASDNRGGSTPRWNPPTAYTATFGQHAPLLRNPLKNNCPADLRTASNTLGVQSPQSPNRSRNFRQLRPWTSNVFDSPAAYGAHYFASTLLKRGAADGITTDTIDSAAAGSASSSVRGASPPHASPASPALRPPVSPAGSDAAAAAYTPASPGTAVDALRARFRPGGPRARFDAEFYHRDPTYTREPGAETRFPRSGPRERQLRALFSPQPPPCIPPRSPGAADSWRGEAAAHARPPSAASSRPAAAGGGGRVSLGLRSWHPTGPGASLARSWSP